jgi:hypothetical protein
LRLFYLGTDNVAAPADKESKVALFHSLFRGREALYSIGGELNLALQQSGHEHAVKNAKLEKTGSTIKHASGTYTNCPQPKRKTGAPASFSLLYEINRFSTVTSTEFTVTN